MSDFAFFGEKMKKFYGFVARSNTNEYKHLLVVRGTEGAWEWWDDAMFRPVAFKPVPEAGYVHSGFDNIYSTMRVVRHPRPIVPGTIDELASAQPYPLSGSFGDQIQTLVQTIPIQAEGLRQEHEVVVMAHSLGGALCTLYVMEHAIKKRQGAHRGLAVTRICTFASPRVGMRPFVKAFNALPIDSWRIANTQDLVPKVPPALGALMPYEHVAEGYEFTSHGMVKGGLQPLCWHSMNTYLQWLDPKTQHLDPKCAR